MSKSMKLFETLQKDIDAVAEKLGVPSVLVMRSLPALMRVEASGGSMEDTYSIGAEGKKSVHPQGNKPLYCERVVDNNAPLFVKDSRLDADSSGNEDEIEFGLNNYYGLPVHSADGTVFGTVCVLANEAREYTPEELQLIEELKQKVEAVLSARTND